MTPGAKYNFYVASVIDENVGKWVQSTVTMNPVQAPQATQTIEYKQSKETIIMKFEVPFDDGGRPISKYIYEINSLDDKLIATGFMLNNKRMLQAS